MGTRTWNGSWRVATGLGALAMAVLLGVAEPARADDGDPRMGVVHAKNAATGALTIGDRTVSVTDRTRLTGLDGQRIEFAEIPLFEHDGGETMVEYQQGPTGAVEWLRVIVTPR